MADGRDVGPRLVDAAVDHPLGVELDRGSRDRLGIEAELQDVGRLDQGRRARARQQVAAGIGGVAHADVTECVEHAFVCNDSVGAREHVAGLIEFDGHGISPHFVMPVHSRPKDGVPSHAYGAGIHVSLLAGL